MKICLAQIRSHKGNVAENIQRHLAYIQSAAAWRTDLILFPELSLTGYEPSLAKELAREAGDSIFNSFQNLADKNKMSIALGMPLRTAKGIVIGMLIFQPNKEQTVYAKQILHEDEFPFFVAGEKDVQIKIGNHNLSFGICYETLQPTHLRKAKDLGATIYLASVAKSEKGIMKAYQTFSKESKAFSFPILMANNVGPSDDFIAAGQTAAWNAKGEMMDQLEAERPGILWIDLVTETTKKKYFEIVNTKIQIAKPSDLSELVQLFKNAKSHLDRQKIFQWTETYPSKRIVERDLKTQKLYTLKKDQTLIGAVTINEYQDQEYQTIDWKFGANKVLVIHRLVVDPAYQSQGYAKQLMDFAEAYALDHRYESIRLDTYTQNKISFEFYKKRGYVLRGQVFFSGRTAPFYCLEKNINPNFEE